MEKQTFTLGHWEDRSGHRLDWKFGYRGEASSFGRVEVVYPGRRHGDHHVTEVTGDRTQHHGRGKAKKVTFTITGAATPTDVALAAVMVGVDTRNLTRNGAIRSVFSRSLTWLD